MAWHDAPHFRTFDKEQQSPSFATPGPSSQPATPMHSALGPYPQSCTTHEWAPPPREAMGSNGLHVLEVRGGRQGRGIPHISGMSMAHRSTCKGSSLLVECFSLAIHWVIKVISTSKPLPVLLVAPWVIRAICQPPDQDLQAFEIPKQSKNP